MSTPPSVPTDDRGLLLGDGLFETILAVDGEPVLLDPHLARMARGCEALGLPALDLDEGRRLSREALAGLGAGRAAVRLTLTAGSGGRGLERPQTPTPRLFATAAPSPKPLAPARLMSVSVRRNDHSPTARLKTLAYLDNVLARREAAAAGCDEALLLNTGGEIACAAAANLFWVSSGRLYTPAAECGALEGIMRRVLIDRAREDGVEVSEVRRGANALEAAEAILLTSSLIGVRPVGALDGRALASHPFAERAMALTADVAA